jgi:hypothetical protein
MFLQLLKDKIVKEVKNDDNPALDFLIKNANKNRKNRISAEAALKLLENDQMEE